MLIVDKVAAFITRDQSELDQLLVFEHPMGDIQLPAGTVELGESIEDAVIREVHEETGIDHAKIIAKLRSFARTLPEHDKIVTRMSKIFSEPAFDSSSEGYGLTRGTPVEVVAEIGPFVEIVTDPLDFSHSPPERVYRVRGYIRKSLLASKIRRHLFHLKVGEIMPDSWTIFSDGLNFQLTWVPIGSKTGLNPRHNQWLESVRSELLASYRDSQSE
jgi:8-oxo-dGTP pyrophosphatase MutT (NUDIX family)